MNSLPAIIEEPEDDPGSTVISPTNPHDAGAASGSSSVRFRAKPGRNPANLPVIIDPQTGTMLPRYEREKAAGIRKDNGARKLTKLSNRHLDMIALRTNGNSNTDIAIIMGCTEITVSRVLNDPLAMELIGRIYKDRQQEIDALAGEAINAVRTGLRKGSMSEKLKATSAWVNLKKTIASETNPESTAEDLAQQILRNAQINGDVNVQINNA